MKNHIRLLVASKNPVKVNAAHQVLSQAFPDYEIDCTGVDAPSGVPEQPLCQAETRQGAVNRLEHLHNHYQADYYVAIEGGVDYFEDGPATFAFIAIQHRRQRSINRSAQLPLPTVVYQRLVNGEELGPVMDELFDTQNIKQAGGAIGLLTNHKVTRQQQYQQTLMLAMAPFFHGALFADDNVT